nr:Cardiolipin synthase [Klebsiella pneumoniae]
MTLPFHQSLPDSEDPHIAARLGFQPARFTAIHLSQHAPAPYFRSTTLHCNDSTSENSPIINLCQQLTTAFAAFLFARKILMRKLITYRHSKGFYIYDNLYTVVNWLVILGYWLLIAGVTLRILMKRRAVPSAMAWLLIIYILPLVGIIAYLSFGELHLGKRRAERARAMWPSTAKWLNDLKACKHIFAEDNSPVAESLFKLCERRQGIGGVKATSYSC